MFLGLCILAPLVEECVFRYFIFKIFGKKNLFPYLLSFFSFIFYHYSWQGENIAILFLQYSVASFGLIYVYKKSNWNLLSPILLHSLINLLFIGILFINPDCFLI
jgi:membrane protease YdiL (CAAX protease family)